MKKGELAVFFVYYAAEMIEPEEFKAIWDEVEEYVCGSFDDIEPPKEPKRAVQRPSR